MNVIELMEVANIEMPTSHPGMFRSPTKYPSVVLDLWASKGPRAAMLRKYMTKTNVSTHPKCPILLPPKNVGYLNAGVGAVFLPQHLPSNLPDLLAHCKRRTIFAYAFRDFGKNWTHRDTENKRQLADFGHVE
jgi:hypothetical protein